MLTATSLLDRDLGLGSLERVELLARLESEFDVRLPDAIAAEANTPDELSNAILNAPGADLVEDEAPSVLRTSTDSRRQRSEETHAGIFSAETLLDVLRYRAKHDADRAHLLISEETPNGQERDISLTFGELYAAAQRCAAEFGAARRTRGRPRVVDAADVSRVFHFVRRHFSRRCDSSADLSAVSRGSH